MDKIVEYNLIEVPMGGMGVAQAPHRLITRGLGSCLGIIFWDPLKKFGAMAHPMLPDISKARAQANPSRFVNSAITTLLEEFDKKGSIRSRIEIKFFGGAHMFSFINADSSLNVGQKNIDMAHQIFKEMGLKVLAEEVGGTFGRTVELNVETGKVLVKTVSFGEKEV